MLIVIPSRARIQQQEEEQGYLCHSSLGSVYSQSTGLLDPNWLSWCLPEFCPLRLRERTEGRGLPFFPLRGVLEHRREGVQLPQAWFLARGTYPLPPLHHPVSSRREGAHSHPVTALCSNVLLRQDVQQLLGAPWTLLLPLQNSDWNA